MRKPLSVFVRKKTKGSTRHFRGATCLTNGAWGFLHIPAKRFNPGSHRQNDDGSDPDFSQFPKDFLRIDRPGADRLCNACKTTEEKLVLWTFLDTGRVRTALRIEW